MAKELLYTPFGVAANWPALNKPDSKFDKFKTDLILPIDDPATEKLTTMIDEAQAEVIAEKKKARPGKKVRANDVPYQDDVDEDGNPTGNRVFKFRKSGGGTRKDGSTYRTQVTLFDSKRQRVQVDVGAGSVISIGFVLKAYDTQAVGVSLQPSQVLIKKLVSGYQDEWGGEIPDDDEDGFTADELPENGNQKQEDEDDDLDDDL